ncbi:MAG: PD40 domain-containing protein, partial [Acidobacteria bacterium]|nr:PD40 domain-containing protein [Acidobacteriota bacterium]
MRLLTQSCFVMLLALVAVLLTGETVRGQASTNLNTKIVFESTRDGNAEIYVSDSLGQVTTRLTNNTWEDQDPVWSPDGRKILFVSNRLGGDTNHQIFEMNADGTNQRSLTNNVSYEDRYPTYSPDGS